MIACYSLDIIGHPIHRQANEYWKNYKPIFIKENLKLSVKNTHSYIHTYQKNLLSYSNMDNAYHKQVNMKKVMKY